MRATASVGARILTICAPSLSGVRVVHSSLKRHGLSGSVVVDDDVSTVVARCSTRSDAAAREAPAQAPEAQTRWTTAPTKDPRACACACCAVDEGTSSRDDEFGSEGVPLSTFGASASGRRRGYSESMADALIVCVRGGQVEAVRLCLDRGGIQPDLANVRGETPLCVACEWGHVDVATLLLNRGADVNRAEERHGQTPLYSACMFSHLDAVRLCLDRGADVTIADNGQWTPLHIACMSGLTEAVRLLLERGADINRVDELGQSPLHLACYGGQADAVRVCLEHGSIYIDLLDDTGDTPLDNARNQGYGALAQRLEHIQEAGSWTRYLSEPRYKLAVLREAAARGWAQRERAFHGKERVLDLLFPGGRPNTRASRGRLHLPDELFSIIARYYWGGEL